MRHLKIYQAIRLIQRTGSIRKAASELAISPSALNRSIQNFEDELTFQVFERLPGGVRLSDAGELLFDLIDRHLVEFTELQSQLGSLRSGETGELRISLGDDISAGVLFDCIAEVERQLPGLSVEISHDNTTQSLTERSVQLALLTNPVMDEKTEVVSAWRCRIGGYQPHPNPSPPTALWELMSHRLLLPPEDTGTRTAISHILRRNRLSIERHSSMSAPQVAHYVRSTTSIALFPEIVMHHEASQAAGQRLDLDLGTVQICALRIKSFPLSRPVQLFLSIVQRKLEEFAAPFPD